jgi:hypothetical protein
MNWSDLTEDKRNDLLRLYETDITTGSSNIHFAADRLQMNPQTLQRRLREHREKKIAQNNLFPFSPTRQYADYLSVKGNDWLVCSDIEIPDHDPYMLLTVLMTGIRFGIKNLIIAGDLIATDQRTLNSWLNTWVEGQETTYEHAIELVQTVLKAFRTHFTTILVLEGNHDDRIARATGGEIHLGMFLNDLVQYSRYPYLWIESSRGWIKVVHPQNFSQDPITLGQNLYNVEPRKSHLILGHCHRQQSGYSPDGQYEIHALGTLRDPSRTRYKAISANKFRQWDQGFLMIRNGYFYPFTRYGTDWMYLLGKEPYRDNRISTKISEQIHTVAR